MNNKPIMPTLRKLTVGEKTSYPIQRLNAVRVSCNHLKLVAEMTFKTHLDKKLIEVERIS